MANYTLDGELYILARAFNRTTNLATRVSIVARYATVVWLLMRIGDWNQLPPPEARLPVEYMPPVFYDYWSIPME